MAMGMIKSSKMGASEAATKLNFIPFSKKRYYQAGFSGCIQRFFYCIMKKIFVSFFLLFRFVSQRLLK